MKYKNQYAINNGYPSWEEYYNWIAREGQRADVVAQLIEAGIRGAIELQLNELKEDERNYYPTATVFVNAPLALIQLGLSARINLLEQLLDLPLSTFPLIKQ